MTEGLKVYEQYGQRHTNEQRQLAAKAALSFLFGADWTVERTISFLAPATDRLFAFAGDEAANLASHELDIMNLPDRPDKQIVEEGVQALMKAFDFKEAPHRRKYWMEVVRNARLASQGDGNE